MVQMELTELDRTIMNMISQGYSTPHIAKTLNYTEGTITNRLTLLFRIFNVKNRTQLVLKAIKYKLLDIQKIKYPRVQIVIKWQRNYDSTQGVIGVVFIRRLRLCH